MINNPRWAWPSCTALLIWLAACGSPASSAPPSEQPAAPATSPGDPASSAPGVSEASAEAPTSTGAVARPDCDRQCGATTQGCGFWGSRGATGQTRPSRSSSAPPFTACEERCCGPERLDLIAPAQVTLEFMVGAAEQPSSRLAISRLGGAGIGPECPSGEWTPERDDRRESTTCPAGRVVIDGIVSSLEVVVTRWREHPEDSYASLELIPPPEERATSGADWLARIAAQLAAQPAADDGDGLLPAADRAGYPVGSGMRAFPSQPPASPRIRFGRLGRGLRQ